MQYNNNTFHRCSISRIAYCSAWRYGRWAIEFVLAILTIWVTSSYNGRNWTSYSRSFVHNITLALTWLRVLCARFALVRCLFCSHARFLARRLTQLHVRTYTPSYTMRSMCFWTFPFLPPFSSQCSNFNENEIDCHCSWAWKRTRRPKSLPRVWDGIRMNRTDSTSNGSDTRRLVCVLNIDQCRTIKQCNQHRHLIRWSHLRSGQLCGHSATIDTFCYLNCFRSCHFHFPLYQHNPVYANGKQNRVIFVAHSDTVVTGSIRWRCSLFICYYITDGGDVAADYWWFLLFRLALLRAKDAMAHGYPVCRHWKCWNRFRRMSKLFFIRWSGQQKQHRHNNSV